MRGCMGACFVTQRLALFLSSRHLALGNLTQRGGAATFWRVPCGVQWTCAAVFVPVAVSCSAPVAAVVASPAWATVQAGQTVPLSAAPQDARGSRLSDRPLTWSSGNAAVATVSGSGLVTGIAPGRATITASSEGKSGTASITVGGEDRGPAPPPANECATPKAGRIWCDDFEQDRLKQYFEYDDAGGHFVRVAGVGIGGSFGMRARWDAAGQVAAGALHLAMGTTPQRYLKPVDRGTVAYRDVFWRLYMKLQPGWRGGGADKLTRAISFASNTWAEAMVAHVWSGAAPGPDQNYLTLDPASGTDTTGELRTTRYNDSGNMRWLGVVRGATPLYADSAAGRWNCVEAHVKLNDPGHANGVFELWINNTLDAQKSSLNWVGRFGDYGINAVFLENYWNAGAVAPEERYLDNFVIAVQRIGC